MRYLGTKNVKCVTVLFRQGGGVVVISAEGGVEADEFEGAVELFSIEELLFDAAFAFVVPLFATFALKYFFINTY
jgi:hypothetical protein